MKKIKILENRPELSAIELAAGMDFTKLKANVAAAKMAALKALIVKITLSTALVTSGIVVYNTTKTTAPKQEPQQLTILADTSKNYTPIAAEPFIDTLKKIAIAPKKEPIKSNEAEKGIAPVQALKAIAPVAPLAPTLSITPLNPITPITPIAKNCNRTDDPSSKEKDTETTSTKREDIINSSSDISCKIWKANNFCGTSNTLDDKYSLECDACEFDYVNCESVKSNEVTCVLIMLKCKTKQDFEIESKLRNITLTDSNGKNAQTPILIGIGSDNKFLGTKFKAKKLQVNYTKQITIYAFFKNAKAGDKLTIKNFVKATIED